MKTIQQVGAAIIVLLLAACTSAPPITALHSAASANIQAHREADNVPPASAERMMLAISRYNENDSEPPVKMHTTDASSEE